MKKLFILLVFILAMCVLLTACKKDLNPGTDLSLTNAGEGVAGLEGNDATAPETTTEPEPTIMSNDEISTKLAALTNEDGTGEIYIGIEREAACRILDCEGIPYTMDEVPRGEDGALSFSNGASYVFDGSDTKIYLTQTNKGLKIGDSASKVKQLYGNDGLQEILSGWGYTIDYPNGITLYIGMNGTEDDATVNYMDIMSTEQSTSRGGGA